ncbi:MAG: hypothetical protein ACD_35C00013G0001 [uncultured bacterium]|nr:MAG: hypothetical protein ACD_35C00013G0001 [uncultured bacterium]
MRIDFSQRSASLLRKLPELIIPKLDAASNSKSWMCSQLFALVKPAANNVNGALNKVGDTFSMTSGFHPNCPSKAGKLENEKDIK